MPHLLSKSLLMILLLAFSTTAIASPIITLPEVIGLFPDYVNHEEQNGFTAPCVDANGKLTLHVNVNDILGTVTEPISVAIVCQQVGLPAFTPLGPVTFSNPAVTLLNLSNVPGHPDAFSLEFVVPLGAGVFDICIENTGWPEGYLNDLLDWAAWDLQSVAVEKPRFSELESNF